MKTCYFSQSVAFTFHSLRIAVANSQLIHFLLLSWYYCLPVSFVINFHFFRRSVGLWLQKAKPSLILRLGLVGVSLCLSLFPDPLNFI